VLDGVGPAATESRSEARAPGAAVKNLRRWASPAVAILVLVIVVWRVGTGPFLDGIKAVDARALLAAAAIVFVTTFLSAWRWTIVARGLGLRLSLPSALAAYYRTLFLNLTLPSGIAGDVYRGISHGRAEHDVSRAVRAVVWERAAGQVVQAVLTIAVLLVLPSPARSAMPFVAAAALAAAIVVVLVGRMRLGGAGNRWTRVRDTVVTDLRDGVLSRSALPAVALTSAVIVIGHAITFGIAARTDGVTVPISRLLPLAVLALLAMVLPSVAGWGPREAVTAWVFSVAGLGADRGAAAAVTYGVLVLAASLPGAVVLIVGWLPLRRFSRARPSRQSAFQ
jgi:uncharacterized membrane protein YbhN (UPF0104 family)